MTTSWRGLEGEMGSRTRARVDRRRGWNSMYDQWDLGGTSKGMLFASVEP